MTLLKKSMPGLRWLVWGLGCAFYFYEFFLQVSPGVMAEYLMRDFSINAQVLGIFSGAYFYSYSSVQLLVGVLLDRLGPHRLLTAATCLCGLASIAFAMTYSLEVAIGTRFVLGVGSAFAVVGTLKLAHNWFPARWFGVLLGALVTVGMLGAIGGEAPLSLMVESIGWRHSMFILGAVGLALSALIFLIAQDSPNGSKDADSPGMSSGANKISTAEERPFWEGLRMSLKNGRLWVVTIYGGLMYLSTPVLCGLWGVPYLQHKYAISTPAAAGLISMILFGWMIGSPLWGYFSEYIKLRKPPLIIGTIGALLSLSSVLYLNISLGMMHVMLFLFGFFSCAFLPVFSIAKEIMPSRYCATAMGFTNMMNMIGIALIQPVIGKILDGLWDGKMVHGVRYYQLANYTTVLSLLPIALLIALALLPFIRETHCRAIDTQENLS